MICADGNRFKNVKNYNTDLLKVEDKNLNIYFLSRRCINHIFIFGKPPCLPVRSGKNTVYGCRNMDKFYYYLVRHSFTLSKKTFYVTQHNFYAVRGRTWELQMFSHMCKRQITRRIAKYLVEYSSSEEWFNRN